MTSDLQTPFHHLLPPLAESEFEALKASIDRDGVRDPIIVDEVGNILDGHNRYRIDPHAPTRVKEGLTSAQKMAFVIASNFQRRNLSPDQKQVLRTRQREIAATLRAEGMGQAEIGAALGVSRQTIQEWLDANDAGTGKTSIDNRVKVPKEEQALILKRAEQGDSQEQIAADFAISRQRVSQICKAERKRREREDDLERQRADIAAGKVVSAAGPFDVIVIDPPWDYGDGHAYDPEGHRGSVPYPTMSLEEIAALDVAERAAPDCVLWLWTTQMFMRHAFPLLDGWGFREKAIPVWLKDRFGLGTWMRSQTEFFIMAARGSPKVDLTNQATALYAPMREHSRKPDEFYTMVESLCRWPRRGDWFPREQRQGWTPIMGNDVSRFMKCVEPASALRRKW